MIYSPMTEVGIIPQSVKKIQERHVVSSGNQTGSCFFRFSVLLTIVLRLGFLLLSL